jgi:adenosine deaminase
MDALARERPMRHGERVRRLVDLPKADLHVHLEGSIRPRTLLDLAVKNGVRPPECLRGGQFYLRDFADFIDQYETIEPCLADRSDFFRIAYEFCEDEAAEGVRYCEVTFTVPGHGTRVGDWNTPVAAVLEGLRAGESDFAIEVGLVLDVVLGFSLEVAERTLEVALGHMEQGVVALGQAGLEPGNPPERFADVFRRAKDAGLHAVPHAGEAAGPESIWGAIESLGAERIGHGIHALDDPALIRELRERHLPLEVCVTSNVRTGVVPTMREHPLPKLLKAGLTLTLNSDDPSLFSSPLAGEYELARAVFGLTEDDLADLARNGIRASFADDGTKSTLLGAIDAWMTHDQS